MKRTTLKQKRTMQNPPLIFWVFPVTKLRQATTKLTWMSLISAHLQGLPGHYYYYYYYYNVNYFYSFRTAACQAAAGNANWGLKVSGISDTCAPWQWVTVAWLWPCSVSPQGNSKMLGSYYSKLLYFSTTAQPCTSAPSACLRPQLAHQKCYYWLCFLPHPL